MANDLGNPDLVEVLRDRMQKHPLKAIPFRDYMELCLYHEPCGYYRNDRFKIGREGDFYTSSSIGSVMGEMIASYIRKECQTANGRVEHVSVVEWGGGSGRLALHILDDLQKQDPALYERLTYIMIESSGYHRKLQHEALQAHSHIIQYLQESEWLSKEQQAGVFVLANELLDAFPVHRVRLLGGCLHESHVAWNEEEGSFKEQWHPLLEPSELLDYVEHANLFLREGQIAELNFQALEWIHTIAECVDKGQILIIDYGDQARELYAEHRMEGTLMCYRKHQAYDNPLIYVGEQDITAHVDFTACSQAALSEGFVESKLQTQREFLVDQGILEQLQNHFDSNPFSEAAKKNRAIRQLLLSDQMSELFKVLILMKKGDPVI